MTMSSDDDAPKEGAVEVTLPDDDAAVTEVELSDKSAKVLEERPVISEKREEAPVAPTSPIDEREKALNDLKRQYEAQKRIADAEKEARKKAEEYAREQARTAYSAQNDVQVTNLRMLQNAIDTTEQSAEAAERAYADAMAAGDYAAAAKAQRHIAQFESQLLQLQNGKARLEESLGQTAEGTVESPSVPDFTPQVQLDPVEAYAQRLTPKSAAWLRANPQAVDKINKLTRAHADAVEDGIVPESDEYFEFIEGRLGMSKGVPGGSEPPEAPMTRSQAAPRKSVASAPVSSNGSVMSPRSSSNPNTMTLTPSEVEVALLMEPELSRDKAIESYARNKAMLIKQGKLTA